ncbi:MAG: response regulator transcription factor [Novosphingobium sp.]|uniref:response regulator transcription factor n=1 Tax=Novosphingobium sp. TaxID=1874826 RepID=UPI0032B80EA7
MRILVVEDNPRMGDLIAQGLRERGFACDVARRLVEADDALASAAFDLILLDVGLPDGDGLDWLRSRPQRGLPPVIVLTARDGLADRITGLDAGADDYLPKPFAMDELAARVRAILRRPGNRAEAVIELGGLTFDPAAQAASALGQRLDLARRELGLFELLMRRAGEVVRRGQIEEGLYAFDEPVTPNAIEAIVSRLRRKLEEAGAAERLHTIRGVGYLLKED